MKKWLNRFTLEMAFTLAICGCAGSLGTIENPKDQLKVVGPVNVLMYWDGKYRISSSDSIGDAMKASAKKAYFEHFANYKSEVIEGLAAAGLKPRLILLEPVGDKDQRTLEQGALAKLPGSTFLLKYSGSTLTCAHNALQGLLTQMELRDEYPCKVDVEGLDIYHYVRQGDGDPVLLWREYFGARLGLIDQGGCGPERNCMRKNVRDLIDKLQRNGAI